MKKITYIITLAGLLFVNHASCMEKKESLPKFPPKLNQTLPTEIWKEILSFLPFEDVYISVARANQKLRNIVTNVPTKHLLQINLMNFSINETNFTELCNTLKLLGQKNSIELSFDCASAC